MHKIFNKKCDECESHRIAYDEQKGELFCYDCGLVLGCNYEFFSLSAYLKQQADHEKLIRKKNCDDEKHRILQYYNIGG